MVKHVELGRKLIQKTILILCHHTGRDLRKGSPADALHVAASSSDNDRERPTNHLAPLAIVKTYPGNC